MVVVGFLMVPALFPLAQMYSFGLTDYRRPADAAVVFGAAVWSGDRPSHALLDRVNTGIELYNEGLVDLLVMSGGPSSGPEIAHEVDVMRRLALDAGVPDEAVVLDYRGINSQATVDNCADIFLVHGIRKALAVSHFYHLPRVKMTFERAGLDVYTVPARETYILYALPYYMAREVAAIWVYYVRPILGF
jgi:vancomycin permeability regulator SanA